MLRIWTLRILPALLCCVLVSPAFADEKLPDGTVSEQVEKLRLQVGDLGKRVADLETRLSKPPEELVEMRKLLLDLQAQLKRMEARDPSRYNSPDGPKMVPEALTGSLRVINRSGVDVNVRLNDKTYEVPAGQVLGLPAQRAGNVVYEVFAENYGILQPQVTRVLKQGDPMTITISPR